MLVSVGWLIYIGIDRPDTAVPRWKNEPTGPSRLPSQIVALYEQSMERLLDGGLAAGDDTSQGYSISKDPIMRAAQLPLIEFGRSHAAEVYRVLADSSSARDRIAAAWIGGYTPQGQNQLQALLAAVNDPNSTVRNNAVRVLAVLAGNSPETARQIPADPFIPMLHSLVWTDRNKALFLLEPITAARQPGTLRSLREQALPALRQMAQWSDAGHAGLALAILGRTIGIPEDRLSHLLKARDTAAILAAAGATAPPDWK